MNKNVRCWLLMALMAFGSGCDGDEGSLKGNIFYGGQGIYSISLEDMDLNPVYLDSSVVIKDLSKIDDSRLLVSAFSLDPGSDRDKVMIYDIRDKVLKHFSNGRRAVFIQAHNKVVFYDGKARLSIADVGESFENDHMVVDRDSLPFLVLPVTVSDDEFIYESFRGGEYGVWKYNIPEERAYRLDQLSNCSLNHAVWIESVNRLLCSERSTSGELSGKYFWVNLDGSGREKMDFGDKTMWPSGYIKELDAIILQERKFSMSSGGESHLVWLYDLTSGDKLKIANNIVLSNSIIYR